MDCFHRGAMCARKIIIAIPLSPVTCNAPLTRFLCTCRISIGMTHRISSPSHSLTSSSSQSRPFRPRNCCITGQYAGDKVGRVFLVNLGGRQKAIGEASNGKVHISSKFLAGLPLITPQAPLLLDLIPAQTHESELIISTDHLAYSRTRRSLSSALRATPTLTQTST